MNNLKIFLLTIFVSYLFCQKTEYLDIGVVIHHDKQTVDYDETKIDYMLSSNNDDIISKELDVSLKKIKLKYGLCEDVIENTEPEDSDKIKNIIQLYLKENYMSSIIQFENALENNSILSDKLLIIADAVYRIGNYKRAEAILHKLPTHLYNDEYWILKSLIYKELGQREKQKQALKNIISLFPNSDYFTLAKLQYKMISR